MDADKIAREIDEAVEQLRISDDSRSTKEVCADVLRKHITPIDWPAVRREAAIAIGAALAATTDGLARVAQVAKEHGVRRDAAFGSVACDFALSLVAEFQRREEFGGGG